MKNKKPKVIKTYNSKKHGNTTSKLRKKGTSAAPSYIVVHNTGSNASARNNCIYFNREGRKTQASADFFIDKDGTIYQYNKIQYAYSWHCGDGHGKYGITNANSVGIEVVSADDVFTSSQIAALRKLVKHYMEFFGIPATHVVRHYDASRKACPGAYAGDARTNKGKAWVALHKKITE